MKKINLPLMKKVVSAVMLLGMLAIDASAQVTIPVGNAAGTGGGTTVARKPYGAFFGYERTALIYLQSELGAAGNISTIAFYLDAAATPANVPVNIYMKHTSSATFAATSTVATEETGATLVYSGTLASWTTGTWITTTLGTQFGYNGTSNLEVIIEANFGGSGGEGSTAKTFRYSSQGTNNRTQYWQADTNPPTTAGTLATYRQNVQFTVLPPPPCSGTPTISGPTATASSYVCSGTPALNLTTYPATVTGINYQWQSSPAGLGTWNNIGTAQTTPAFTSPAISANTDYRVQATCTSTGGGTATSTTATVAVATTPTISGATATGTAYNCSGSPALALTTYPVGASSISYQWQSSPAGLGTWTNTGAPQATPAYTSPAIFASKDFRVQASCTTTGGGTATSNTATVTITSATVSPTTATLCATNGQALAVTIPSGVPTTPIFTENFNSGSGPFTLVNTSTGGTQIADANWINRPSGYTWVGTSTVTFVTPTGTNFMLTNMDDASGLTTSHTEMISPVINTYGYTALRLNYSHYFKFLGTTSYGRVEVTTNGTTWVPVVTYQGADAGAANAFATPSLNLDAYINQSNFQFRFVYNGGWDWWWAIDDIALLGSPLQTVTWSASPSVGAGLPAGSTTPSVANANITVTPTAAGTYVYTGTTSGCGSVTSTFTVNPAPTSAFTVTTDSVCSGTTATVSVQGTGNTVVTFFDGVSNHTINTDAFGNGSYTTPALATGTYTYSMVSVQGTSCTVNNTGTMTVVSTPRPAGQITSIFPTAICNGTSANLSVAGITSYTWPATIHYTNGVTTSTFSTSNNSDNISVNPPTGSYTYSINYIEDAQGCQSLPGTTPGTAALTVNPSPSATIAASAPSVCSGSLVTYTVTLTGTGPWDFTYTDGTTPVPVTGQATSPYTFTTNPTSVQTYYFTSLSDASGCAALAADYNGTATVTIGSPAAVTDPTSTSTICDGGSASFSVSATGLNVTYQWLVNGNLISNGGVYSGANTNTLNISNVAGLNGNVYKAIANGQCGVPDTSNGATLNSTSINTWSGAISSDWNVGANWSCGSVPVITTDVMIPNVTNDPIVMNFPTALGNTLNIATGGSLTVNFGDELRLNSTIVNNGTFNLSSGKLILSGPGTQNIPAGMYLDLEVNGGGVKILDGNAMVDNILTLTNGWIQLNNYNLTLGAPQLTVGGNTGSYIITNGTGVVTGLAMDIADSVTFHVGNANYNALGMRNKGTNDDFSVRVADAVYQDGVGTSTNSVTFPVVNATWFVSEATTGGSYVTMSPHYFVSQGINNFDNGHVYVAHHNGTMWVALFDSATVAPLAGGLSPYYATADSVSAFSPFTVASGNQFPLSVKISDITAANVGTRNKINWASSTEATGAKYELQRSIDGKNFTGITTVNAKGEASSYTYFDETPATGVNYYRVKLVDLNGEYGYSKIVAATVKGAFSAFSVDAYPNPVSSVVTVKVNGTMSDNASVTVTDVTGKVIRTAKLDSDKLDINLGDIASGVYFIKYSDDTHHESIKINKQ